MSAFDRALLRILELSVAKNGEEKVLTISHLRNIVKRSIELENDWSDAADDEFHRLVDEIDPLLQDIS